MTEYFHTFLIPIIFELSGIRYLVWGYREVDDEIVGFSAALSEDQAWTKSQYFSDKALVEEFKTHLPPRKRKRKHNA